MRLDLISVSDIGSSSIALISISSDLTLNLGKDVKGLLDPEGGTSSCICRVIWSILGSDIWDLVLTMESSVSILLFGCNGECVWDGGGRGALYGHNMILSSSYWYDI